jgi:NAD(P)H-hydrate epimerase
MSIICFALFWVNLLAKNRLKGTGSCGTLYCEAMSNEPGAPLRLSRAQVREIDRVAIDEYGVPGVVLMENAAQSVVAAALRLMVDFRTRRALILCGGGNNGGDGLAAARLLHNRGADVHVATAADPDRYAGDAAINWRIVRAMGLAATPATPDFVRGFGDAVVVDAIFGTGLNSPPRQGFTELVAAIADSENAVLAVDLPSGLDCDTGEPLGGVAVVADRTVTFVAEKLGFANPAARRYLGEVAVGDIGCPRDAIRRVVG